jgi:hypothetical protein
MIQIFRDRTQFAIVLTFLTLFGMLAVIPQPIAAAELPSQLSDEQFWKLITDFSETGGYFRSDNFVSNETTFQFVIPELKNTIDPGGVYMGVGPDQNFTYIVNLEPKIAFIFDIRRQNMLQHLMYKALIEISADRSEFVSRLFSRPRPEGLNPTSTAEQLFAAYEHVPRSRELYMENFAAILRQLEQEHRFSLSPEDEKSIEYVFNAFYVGGLELNYNGPSAVGLGGRGRMPSFSELMIQTDREGLNRSYMSSEETFRTLQQMERKNLVVPLVGDFAGPKAIRAVGEYLREHDATVSVFYLSNVEQYLFQQDDDWSKFFTNVGTLPLASNSTFIRSIFNGLIPPRSTGFGLRSASVLSPIDELLKAFGTGQLRTYYDVIQMSH